MDESAAQALARLVRAAQDGTLDELCVRHGVRLLGAFGSAARGEPAQDLDLAVSFVASPPPVLALLDELTALTGFDRIDLLVLDDADPVARAEGLVGLPLYEHERGAYAIAQMAALAERRDTEWLRRLELDLLAG